ncbi:MAG: pullulanase-type alpha-1,6-glucosidase [Betaproteobacteria bacterium]
MTRWAAAWALSAGALSAVAAGLEPAKPADCDGPHEQVLQAALPMPAAYTAARAAWLDGSQLRWAGAPAQGPHRYRLHHSRQGLLAVAPGDRVAGGDGVLTLQVSEPAAENISTRRFSHVGPGATLALRAVDLPRLPALLREQVLLTREDSMGRVLDATHVQLAGALDAVYASAGALTDLGVQVQGRRTGFKLWAPTARQVQLCLFGGTTAPARELLPLRRDAATGAWQHQHAADLSGQTYAYLVDVHVRGKGLVRNRVTDPYALSLTADSQRSQVVDLDAPTLKPEGWDSTERPRRVLAATDLVLYELHVRDFSIGDASVPPAHRGKYLAFTAAGSNGMRHLAGLAAAGVTDIHLLPVFDIASVPEQGCVSPDAAPLAAAARAHPGGPQAQALLEPTRERDCFNWGYDPWHYTVPEGSYATDAADGTRRIVEFRRMVQALHRTGLRVGMDVVYNHTTASGQHPKSVLDRIVPGYYHRLDATGAVTNSTCCDNTATEHLMMGKLMTDSAVVWARDYRIDSFRFDLMGHQPRAAMEQLQRAVDTAAGRHIHLIGEGWNFGEIKDGVRFVQAAQGALNGSGIGTFSDRGRDAVRGGGCCDSGPEQVTRQGWVSGLHTAPNEAVQAARGASTAGTPGSALELMRAADLVRVALAGTVRGVTIPTASGQTLSAEKLDYAGQGAAYASQPGEVVNYTENHDNQTLFDLLAFKLPLITPREERARVQHLANAVVAFSQGIAYFHAGQEMLRSKSMDRNSYDSGDWFNRIDWTFTDNGFGAGLPPRQDNESSWPLMAPRLADPALKPTAGDIAWTRDAFLDLLRIRSSTTLLRLRSTEDIQTRLRFMNTGPQQVGSGAVVGAHLDGQGYPGAGFRRLAYLINADTVAHRIPATELAGQPWTLHPVLAARGAADWRAAQATWDAASASFIVPARSAVVWVAP